MLGSRVKNNPKLAIVHFHMRERERERDIDILFLDMALRAFKTIAGGAKGKQEDVEGEVRGTAEVVCGCREMHPPQQLLEVLTSRSLLPHGCCHVPAFHGSPNALSSLPPQDPHHGGGLVLHRQRLLPGDRHL